MHPNSGNRFATATGSRILVLMILCVCATSVAAQTAAWGLNGTSAYYNNGNVGIGTSSPVAKLHVQNVGSSFLKIQSTGSFAYLDMQPASDSQFSYINYGDGATYGWQFGKDAASGTFGGPGAFFVAEIGPNVSRLNIAKGGNVGIGVSAPTAKLHVAGNAIFTGTVTGGNIQAQYQDVAEWVPSTRDMAPGTVVALDPDRTNNVLPSSKPYDTRVAGVISAQPGVLLGEGGKGKVMVATTGRVKVRVHADRSIAVGDLLVSSGEEGVATVSEPIDVAGIKIHRPGTIIGKALEPMAAGRGEILVLLSLQ